MTWSGVTLGLLLLTLQSSGGSSAGLNVLPAPTLATVQRSTLPVLAFPEPGIDDTAAYQGYRTRFYRDSKNNTVQIYLQPEGGRVVLVWADAANESVGFTARDAAGRPARLEWGAEAADVSDSGKTRTVEFRLTTDESRIDLGGFVLGSMRVERDFVYAKRHLQPFTAPPLRVSEESLLVADVTRLPPGESRRHLTLLNATSVAELRERLLPTIESWHGDTVWGVKVERPSLDGRNLLGLEILVDARKVKTRVTGHMVSLLTRPGSPVRVRVKVSTDAAGLTPLSRDQIFNRSFLDFVDQAGAAQDSAGAMYSRRLERQVRGVELLSSEEKLMAGLPNFATYFGRDMMMTALMMRPIWSPGMTEHVISSVLRKLGPRGDVSHEEALGGQAIRENAMVYDSLMKQYFRAIRRGRRQSATSTLEQARAILQDLQATRENYHMIDDEFQLPVLGARYLADSAVPSGQKRSFLLDKPERGVSRLRLLLRELALVASRAEPYRRNPRATNLVSFPRRDATHWRSASWRDSDAGYAGGRFAMDINVIWVPEALESIATILASLPDLGFPISALDSLAPEIRGTPLAEYARDSAALDRAQQTWRGARKHFRLTLSGPEIRRRTRAKLAWMGADERPYWQQVMSSHEEAHDSLEFLVLSLDGNGRPIPVVNTDPATELFLTRTASADVLLEDIAPFLRPYPVGLFVEGLGPLVANDAYASPAIWARFKNDAYHGPRVVWGREVNLLLLGLANHISGSSGDEARPALDTVLRRTLAAVNASGLQHNELWSYRIKTGRLVPVRYGTSSDVQLWNTTNLVVQYALSKLSRP